MIDFPNFSPLNLFYFAQTRRSIQKAEARRALQFISFQFRFPKSPTCNNRLLPKSSHMKRRPCLQNMSEHFVLKMGITITTVWNNWSFYINASIVTMGNLNIMRKPMSMLWNMCAYFIFSWLCIMQFMLVVMPTSYVNCGSTTCQFVKVSLIIQNMFAKVLKELKL